MDEPRPSAPALDRLAAHLDALEFQRSSNVRIRLNAAIELERDAEARGATLLAMRARLVRADMLQREGHPTAAASLANEVSQWARAEGERALLARSHLVLSSIHEGIGDAAATLDHALAALGLADETTPTRMHGNLVLRLADALAEDGSLDQARDRYREAQRVFASIGDVERQISTLNNLAYSECVASDAEQAWRTATEMRDLASRNGIELDPSFAETLARAALGVGRLDEAEAVLGSALALLARSGDIQARTPAEILITLAEVQRRRGELDEAQESLNRCVAVCEERDLASVAADALAEQAELHAANGRFDLAYATHKRYHAQAAGLASERREAAVRTRQVLFETDEARRAAAQYWRQARTDQLSGLPNRRMLDEELARRLGDVVGGEPLLVAIVDADRFKRINDTFSHAAGDRAIAELARVLEASLAGPARPGRMAPLVGRLGGEEFLVLLPSLDQASGEDALERLREAVAGHDWLCVVEGLSLTVSVGGTMARPEDSPGDVLRRADAQLYAAKRAGRDRVAVDRSIRGRQPGRSARHGPGRRAQDTSSAER